jgi:hypothetical protein
MHAESASPRRTPVAAGTVPRSSPPRRESPAGINAAADARRPAAVVFALLVFATAGGLFLAQRIKHTPTSVQGFRLQPSSFSPTAASALVSPHQPSSPRFATDERLSFRISTNDAVTVTIVGSAGETVATLVRDLPWPRYLRLCLEWNGRRGNGGVLRMAPAQGPAGICPTEPAFALPAGQLAPAGDYRVRVSLRHQRRSVLSPASFALVGAATTSP